ncbi:MAG: FAD-dependent oxidoreductase [Deltaproteobacteria bacterium]|nr:FAD-dependent oxidoreductase [Deltaproteobacteria bacterium]MDA8308311.1 FAD-dependent oxidoreductase [Deltaproteobacteria bacterium]
MESEFDVVILGSGPAGLQAAVHAARAKAATAVLGKARSSALYKAHVENYCCLNDIIAGEDIINEGRRQAEKFGAVLIDEDVLHIERLADGRFSVKLESGDTLRVWTIVLAMGVSRNRLNVPGEKELLGRGVSYCVDCDANFFRNRAVTIVGSGSAAASGALRMLLVASETHLVYESLEVSDKLRYQLESCMAHIHPGRKVSRILGDSEVRAVLLDNGEEIETSGIFIELGAKGAIELVTGLGVALDTESMRFVAVNKKQETNVPGIYAAGDICGPPWQVAKAVGEGCVAGLEAATYARRAVARVVRS